jgi:hypothetical protein
MAAASVAPLSHVLFHESFCGKSVALVAHWSGTPTSINIVAACCCARRITSFYFLVFLKHAFDPGYDVGLRRASLAIQMLTSTDRSQISRKSKEYLHEILLLNACVA